MSFRGVWGKPGQTLSFHIVRNPVFILYCHCQEALNHIGLLLDIAFWKQITIINLPTLPSRYRYISLLTPAYPQPSSSGAASSTWLLIRFYSHSGAAFTFSSRSAKCTFDSYSIYCSSAFLWFYLNTQMRAKWPSLIDYSEKIEMTDLILWDLSSCYHADIKLPIVHFSFPNLWYLAHQLVFISYPTSDWTSFLGTPI